MLMGVECVCRTEAGEKVWLMKCENWCLDAAPRPVLVLGPLGLAEGEEEAYYFP